MRPASVPLLVLLLGWALLACAGPRAETLAQNAPIGADTGAERGAELYGRYCTGCHASNLRGSNARGSPAALMHIQARVGMATLSSVPETVTRDDARRIVDYLGAGGTTRVSN